MRHCHDSRRLGTYSIIDFSSISRAALREARGRAAIARARLGATSRDFADFVGQRLRQAAFELGQDISR